MWMTLVHTGIGDTCELRLMKGLDCRSAAIAHTRTESSHHLVDYLLHRTFVGYASGNTLWHQLLHILRIALEIAIL